MMVLREQACHPLRVGGLVMQQVFPSPSEVSLTACLGRIHLCLTVFSEQTLRRQRPESQFMTQWVP